MRHPKYLTPPWDDMAAPRPLLPFQLPEFSSAVVSIAEVPISAALPKR